MCLIVWDGHGWVGVGWDWDWFGPISIMDGVQKVWIDEERDKVEADIEGWRQFVLRWKWF